MLFGSRGLRATARITLFFFTWMIGFPTLAAATAPPAPTAPAASVRAEPNLLDDLREAALRARDRTGPGASPAAANPSGVSSEAANRSPEAEVQRLLQGEAALADAEREAEAGFAEVEQHLQDHHLPAEIQQRQHQALADYRVKMKALKAKLRAFTEAHGRNDETQSRRALNDLADFLEQEQKTRPRQPFDPKHLPFATPNDQVRAPKERKEELDEVIRPKTPAKVAASKLSPGLLVAADPAPSTVPTPEDLAETKDVQITPAIRAQAETLHNNPVEIYNFVRNSVEFLPTYGSIQGSDLTLQTQRGNAFDTASLLIALLRAAKIPARYVYGTIQVPAGEVMNWVGGVETPEAAQSLLGQGGIPSVGLVSGGKIAAFKLEHVWVEAFVDYIPSRGAKHVKGDTWVAMDASFKQYDYTAPLKVAEIAGFDIAGDLAHLLQSATLDSAHSSLTGVDGEFLRSRLAIYQDNLAAYARTQPNPLTLDQGFGGKTLRKQSLPILAGSLPYSTVAVTSRVSALPDTLRHSVRLEFFASPLDRSSGAYTLSRTLSLPRLGGQRLGITYVPASAADAAVFDSLDATEADSIPLYLVRVKPQIKLDNTVMAEDAALAMGADHYLDVVLSGPGSQRRLSFARIAGDEMVVSVDAAGVGVGQVTHRFQTTPSDTAAENLQQLGLHYWAEADFFNRLNQTAYGVTAVRLPSVGVVSSPLSVIYNFGIPRTGYYLKRNIDIKLSHNAVVGASPAQRLDYLGHIGAIGSYLESSVQEQLFHNWQGTGLSTLQVFLDANAQGIPIYALTAANAPAVLGRLQIPADALSDIQSALSAGFEVMVPERVPAKAVGVAGIGYQVRDPATGSASYRIWGGTNGGDGETPCAERQRVPVAQAVRDIVLTAIVLAALAAALVAAGWYIGGMIGAGLAGAGGAKPVLAAIMAGVGLSALTFPATAGSAGCNPNPVPRNNNGPKNAVHNQCANTRAGNRFPDMDACVWAPGFPKPKKFDAFNGAVLWEVKTYNFDNDKDNFVREVLIPDLDLPEAANERGIAKACNFGFLYTVGDPRHATLLQTLVPGFVPAIADQLEIDSENCLQR